MADGVDNTSGSLLKGIGNAEHIVEDGITRAVDPGSGKTVIAIVVGVIGIIYTELLE